MARSPFTLAASVTSALPNVSVTGVSALSEGSSGRYDSAIADLDDGRRVVIQVPTTGEAEREMLENARALTALTPGIRSLLPFQAPQVLGEVSIDQVRAIVVDFLPGYRVDPAHLPAGRGAATSLGEALASLHSLPVSLARTEGLRVSTPEQVHATVTELVDQVDATGHVPIALIARWRRALGHDRLWRFESTVILGGSGVSNFLFEDVDGIPVISGALDWHELSVGDPASDLHWLAAAPRASDDVLAAYSAGLGRAPDALLRERARFYAELEFARWLLHGQQIGDTEIINDAVDLLDSLAKGVSGDDVVPQERTDVSDAMHLLDQVPEYPRGGTDTAMQTDAYDPDELARWADAQDSCGSEPDDLDDLDDQSRRIVADQGETEPIDPLDPGDSSVGR